MVEKGRWGSRMRVTCVRGKVLVGVVKQWTFVIYALFSTMLARDFKVSLNGTKCTAVLLSRYAFVLRL